MAGLSSISYVNIRHQLPVTGIRQNQAKLDKAGFQQAELHTDYKAPVNRQHLVAAKVDINQYRCRKAVGGFQNNEDFARSLGQQGWEHISEVISKHTRDGWDSARNAAKKGRVPVIEQEVAKMWSQAVKWPQWDVIVIPPPEFTVTPARLEGDIDPGHLTTSVDATPNADIKYSPGTAETYMKDQGFIRMWVTQGYVDVEA